MPVSRNRKKPIKYPADSLLSWDRKMETLELRLKGLKYREIAELQGLSIERVRQKCVIAKAWLEKYKVKENWLRAIGAIL